MTICNTCGVDFEKKRTRSENYCPVCMKVISNERGKKWKQENHDQVLESAKRYHEENRERLLEKSRKYNQENADIIRIKNRLGKQIRRQENPEKFVEETRRIRNEHLDEYRRKTRERQQEYQDLTSPFADNHGLPWTDEDVQFLRDNSDKKTAEDIALALRRTYFEVSNKAKLEGISFHGDKKGIGRILGERLQDKWDFSKEFEELPEEFEKEVEEMDEKEINQEIEQKDEHKRIKPTKRRKKTQEITKRHIFRKGIVGQ